MAGRYAESADEARLAVQASATRAPPHFGLAAALQRAGHPEQAQRAMQEALARGPFQEEMFRRFLASSEPRLVEGRERLIATIKGLLPQ